MKNFMGEDLSHRDLSGADLHRSCLVGVNLESSDLKNANLFEAFLSGAKLRKANLKNACLYGARLIHTDLFESDLSGADLRNIVTFRACLHKSILTDADLRCADLTCADLRGANLSGANLKGANLSGANLSGANLSGANLSYANLKHANLAYSDLRYNDLRYTNLHMAVLINTCIDYAALDGVELNIPLACPENGSYIGYKKAHCKFGYVIVKLLIPDDALRSSSASKKCRASKAKVLSIEPILDDEDDEINYIEELEISTVYSINNPEFKYSLGEWVHVEDFDANRWNECSTGIHHFINKNEAIKYWG